MVIVCPECSTKFRVKPERIPAGGAKVRCARCKHIFLAEKPEATDIPQPLQTETAQPVSEPQPVQPASSVAAPVSQAAIPDSETAGDSLSTAEAEAEVEEETDDSSFSYDQFRDLDTTKTDSEEFTFSGKDESVGAPQQEDATSAQESAAAVTDDEETFSFSAPVTEPAESVIETAEAEPAAPETEITANEPLASEPAAVPDPATEEIAAPATVAKKSSLPRILLLLILGLLIIGGTLYYINGPQQINQVIQQLLGQQTNLPPHPGQIAVVNLQGKFINNQESGELFVIRGEATNNFSEARASIQVKGVIFDQKGKPLLQKTIFCGNPISDQELQTLSFGKLEEMMGNQFGKSLKNMKINSKQAIPFVIAFRDLPKDLSEFSVDVTSSEPAAQ